MIDALLKNSLQGLSVSSEGASLAALITALIGLWGLHRMGGLAGLYLYNGLVVCLANLQLLHVAYYVTGPIPLGTVLFTTLFLSDTLITNFYGDKAAQKGVALNILAYVFFTSHMLIALMHPPAGLTMKGTVDPFLQEALQNYRAMESLFLPSVRFFVASCVASLISQMSLIRIFGRIKVRTKSLYLNQFVSTFSASVIDHIVFTFVAFFLLAEIRPSIDLFWKGYVVASFVLRLLILISFIAISSLWTLISRRFMTSSLRR